MGLELQKGWCAPRTSCKKGALKKGYTLVHRFQKGIVPILPLQKGVLILHFVAKRVVSNTTTLLQTNATHNTQNKTPRHTQPPFLQLRHTRNHPLSNKLHYIHPFLLPSLPPALSLPIPPSRRNLIMAAFCLCS